MDKVRIGFIGAGWWATTNHMPVLAKREDVEMAGVCRLGSEMLQRVKEKFDFPFATEDYHELLDQELDGVVVTSPHHLHHEHARAALLRGYHVMCEKPMTLEADQAWELVNLAKERNLHLIVPYGWHYKPIVNQAKQLMEEGVVGNIEYVLCHMASSTKELFGGSGLAPEQQQPVLSFTQPDPTTWQVKENGGGYAHGQITHSSGLMFWLTGLRAKEVTARMSAPNSSVDMYDAATVTFDNGAIGVVSGAATLPPGSGFQVDVRIFGSEGVLNLDLERARLDVLRHDGNHRRIEVAPDAGRYDCDGPPNRFVELIKGEGTNDSPGEVGARSVELLDAMFQSVTEGGKAVRVG
ncbi:MAG: Gfo/Idh/MocA family oxidoreductase [Caldilineaceae bacterium]|nr:Gfo/Idh/MocA family oxidoreductase [Caldilineaceae bacterium]